MQFAIKFQPENCVPQGAGVQAVERKFVPYWRIFLAAGADKLARFMRNSFRPFFVNARVTAKLAIFALKWRKQLIAPGT